MKYGTRSACSSPELRSAEEYSLSPQQIHIASLHPFCAFCCFLRKKKVVLCLVLFALFAHGNLAPSRYVNRLFFLAQHTPGPTLSALFVR